MALPIWQGVVTDESGDVISGAEITVVNEATGTDADIYSDRAGSSSKSNPFFTGSDGFIQFYAAPGSYRITADSAGGTRTWRYEALIDPTTDTSFTGETSLPGGLTDVAGTPDFDNMPTVGGDPIVEDGSNSDGEWTRFADGTQHCWREISNFDGSSSSVRSYDFAKTFIGGSDEQPAGSVSMNFTGIVARHEVFAGLSVQTRGDVGWQVVTTVTRSENIDLTLLAIGRWK